MRFRHRLADLVEVEQVREIDAGAGAQRVVPPCARVDVEELRAAAARVELELELDETVADLPEEAAGLLLERRRARKLQAEGFRSPATHRVVDWIAELPVTYDGTMFHSDPYEPQPGGCFTLWPFRIGPVVELPYTLPQDHTLFTLLRQRTPGTWLRQVDAIEERNGLVHSLSHPDPDYLGDPDKRALYREFLDALAERPALWRALPREIAQWWIRRPTDPQVRLGTIRRDGDSATLDPPAARS
jgi:hypothetical protein